MSEQLSLSAYEFDITYNREDIKGKLDCTDYKQLIEYISKHSSEYLESISMLVNIKQYGTVIAKVHIAVVTPSKIRDIFIRYS